MPKKKKSKSPETEQVQERTGKHRKLFNSLTRTMQQFILGKSYVPLTYAELIDRLHIVDQHRDLFLEVLTSLVDTNVLSISLGRYSLKQVTKDVITGVIHLHPRGFGFVKPNESTTYTQDIFIPKHLTLNAVDGDSVEVLVNTEVVSDKGPEGRVTTILSRSKSHIAGIITEARWDGTFHAFAPMLGASKKIIVETNRGEKLALGDRIVMEVVEWGNKDAATLCKFSNLLGNMSDPTCDIPAAIEEFGLRKDFPKKVSEEAKQFGTRVPLEEIKKREDLRSLVCFTIDPDTAKDFDDAVSLTKDRKGHYHLGVHIADVSHYIQKGSALDEEAQLRCNSTYFPGFCLPMLPRELSDNLCSLKPNVNRLTASVMMEFDPSGTLCNYRMTRSVIKSCKRFTYREAKAVLDGLKKSPLAPNLHLMVELCGLLKKKRYERGSVEFGLPELVLLVDEKGMPTKTDYVVYDISHQLIEEFMLKANETVAYHLAKEGKDLTYRIHDEPSEENMKDFSLLAAAFGFHLSPTPTPREIQKLFDEAMETAYGTYLASSYIRRMRLAIYSSDNIGHYGLSLTHYCHFTSPIRRYVDLVSHRILFHGASDKASLQKIAEHCSEQERISAKAENSVVLLKKLRLLDLYYKEDPKRQYQAIVTRVKNFGVYFEIADLMLESYLHVSELEDDYYIYDDEAFALRGSRYGQSYKAGDKITVMLGAVDLISQESKWHLVGGPESDPTIKRDRNRNFKKNKNKKSFSRDNPKRNSKRTEQSQSTKKLKPTRKLKPREKSKAPPIDPSPRKKVSKKKK